MTPAPPPISGADGAISPGTAPEQFFVGANFEDYFFDTGAEFDDETEY